MSFRKKSKFMQNKKWKIILGIIIVLIVIRLVLPYILLHYANKTLATMEGYFGHIEDLDLSLYRGAYTLEEFYIDKVDSLDKSRTPFISSKLIDLSVEWEALFNGKLVGELIFYDAELRFTLDKAEPAQVQKDTTDFRVLLNKFMPLKVNRFEINNGKLRYSDPGSSPPVDLVMQNAYVIGKNLSSVKDTALLPSSVNAQADLYGGKLNLEMKLDPFANKPAFDLNVELRNTDLTAMNSFFKAYGKFDVNKGTMGLYAELATKDDKYIGYVKPVIKDLDVLGPEDKKDSFIHRIWEGIVGLAGSILKNPKEKQIATKIPIEIDFGKTQVKTWYAVMSLLRNAFIQALQPSIDQQINIGSVGTLSPKEIRKANRSNK